jgi:hypothetical protein
MTKADRDQVRSEFVALRISPAELAEIDARAQARNMSRSSYMIEASCGTLDVDPVAVEAEQDRRLDELERRLARIEELAIA